MTKLTQYRLKQLSQQRWLWSLLLIIWLVTLNTTNVHLQKHNLINDVKCQLCLNSFHHTPFININPIIPVLTNQQIIIIAVNSLSIAKQLPARFFNRGPPLAH
jgi:hypothetical protein